MNWQPTLENDLILLRPLQENDFEALYEVAKDPLIWEQHPSYDRYKREVYTDFFIESMESNGALITIDKENGQVIGGSRFQPVKGTNRAIEIGWSFLARQYWGGKYNRVMKKLMVNYALDLVEDVVLFIEKNNIRSQKAALKIGATKVVDTKYQYLMSTLEADFTYRINNKMV